MSENKSKKIFIQDCDTAVGDVYAAPFSRYSPAEEWAVAFKNNSTPQSFWDLYRECNYLSFDSRPNFFTDPTNKLWGYFVMLMGSLNGSFVELDDLIIEIKELNRSGYDPVKSLIGDNWDKKADLQFRRKLKYYFMAVTGIFDLSSELISLFFPSKIKGLTVGLGSIQKLEKWLKAPLNFDEELIVTPDRHFLESLHSNLQPIVKSYDHDKQWLDLILLLRNKMSHFGNGSFCVWGVQYKTLQIKNFLPRTWPFLTEEGFQSNADSQDKFLQNNTMKNHLEENLVHQDIDSFLDDIQGRAILFVEKTCEVLLQAYKVNSSLPYNQVVLDQLNKNTKHVEFLHF